MRRKWTVLCALLASLLGTLGACGVTDLQLRDFVTSTGSRAVVTAIVDTLQAAFINSQGT